MRYKKIKLTNSNLGGGGTRKISKIKAFTLIELLAIIVILAIIAVITVPIILNIIENSRKGAAIDSAYGYRDAVNQYYVAQLANEGSLELNGKYKVDEKGYLTLNGQEGQPIEISFTGSAPKGGTLNIDEGSVESGCLTIGNYKVTLTKGNVEKAEKGECSESLLGDGGDQSDEPSKFGGTVDTNVSGETYKAVVYLDPTDFSKECDENKVNSTTGTKEGCMRWFVFDDSNGTYTMILDHNTTATVAWVSSTDYADGNKASEVGITYSGESAPAGTYGSYGNNDKGPLTVLSQLKTDTDSWSDELGTPETYKPSSGDFQWTINYSDYRARLITAEEVAEITKENRTKEDSSIGAPEDPWTLRSSWFLLDKETASCYEADNCDETDTTSKYWWLFDNTDECTTYGCKKEDSSTYGYWTSSPRAGHSDYAWKVDYYGRLYNGRVNDGGTYGVRPVITVSKSKFLQE